MLLNLEIVHSFKNMKNKAKVIIETRKVEIFNLKIAFYGQNFKQLIYKNIFQQLKIIILSLRN